MYYKSLESKIIITIFLFLTLITGITLSIYLKIQEKKHKRIQQTRKYELIKQTKGPINDKFIVYGLRKKATQIYKRKPLLTDCEKKFLFRLENIFKDMYIIQPQIPLRMIVEKSNDGYDNELNKYIDFGLLDENRNIVALIELNDKSHLYYERIKRDKSVAKICKEIGIPLITFWTQKKYTNEEILERINLIIKGQKNENSKDN